jgi:hypothetical protein
MAQLAEHPTVFPLYPVRAGPGRLGNCPGLLETGIRKNPRSGKRGLADHIGLTREFWIVTSALLASTEQLLALAMTSAPHRMDFASKKDS